MKPSWRCYKKHNFLQAEVWIIYPWLKQPFLDLKSVRLVALECAARWASATTQALSAAPKPPTRPRARVGPERQTWRNVESNIKNRNVESNKLKTIETTHFQLSVIDFSWIVIGFWLPWNETCIKIMYPWFEQPFLNLKSARLVQTSSPAPKPPDGPKKA